MYEYFMGIDISKDSFDAALLNSDGEIKSQYKLSMDREGFDKLLGYLSIFDKDKLLISMESTGVYYFPLLSYLIRQGFKCTVINPLLIKHFIASQTLRKTKTDKKDACLIALFAMKSGVSLHIAALEMFEDIKVLAREREALCSQIARVKTEIKGNISVLFPELANSTDIFSRRIMGLLSKTPSAQAIQRLKTSTLEKMLKHSVRGNKLNITAEEILTLANNSIAVPNKYLERVLISKMRRLISACDELALLDKELEEFLKDNEDINNNIDILESIPGVGNITSKNFMVEVSSIDRFASRKQLCAYIGLDPSLKQSGSSINHNGNISKRGNPRLRRTLWQMALGAIRVCDKFRAYYYKKRAEGKKYKQAVIAVANKLLRTIFSLLKNKTMFDKGRIDGISNVNCNAVFK